MKTPGRPTFWLSVLVVSLAALCLALFEGLGAGIEWYPELAHPLPASPTAPATVLETPTLESYAEIWGHSLFNRDRKPDPVAWNEHDTQSLAGFSLNGIAVSQTLRKALFKTKEGKSLSVAQGDTLPNGWRIERITTQTVSLSFKSSQQELSLPVLKLPASAVH
ncbi:general secretion pathway protein GspN [Pseudomonas gingeri]|uniref:general secretion pathway protein GspN n=1 Tax=Pseudomonas gingeri TaxID=117681 RepID=UPI0015A31603|nr:general secretion pathway protein GspN [Pseudomonas gingeri]NWD72526.1 general secretion pathway protein GspN [Pseudomonas gingeri]